MAGAGAIAATSIIIGGLVDVPAVVGDGDVGASTSLARPVVEQVQRPVRYVRLEPGERAPKGARVIEASAPAPRIVVQRVVVGRASSPARTVARTRQSGG
jgi:hypothetical protein